jgi:hypothetical protein
MRAFAAVALSASLLVSSAAMAADNVAPLAPGKPAGIHKAELNTTTIVLLGIGVFAAIAIGVASGSNGSPVQPTSPTGTTTG